MRYHIETHDLDGEGERRCRVYYLPPVAPGAYWSAVTDVLCPCCPSGTIRWAEAGYVAGHRICDDCGRHFLAAGDHTAPALIRVGTRRSRRPGGRR